LGSNFRQQLWGAAFRSFGATALENSFGHNFVEQRRGAALGRSFEEQFCTAALKNFSFGDHLCERNFGEQLSAATLGSSFREPLWRLALGNRFEA